MIKGYLEIMNEALFERLMRAIQVIFKSCSTANFVNKLIHITHRPNMLIIQKTHKNGR